MSLTASDLYARELMIRMEAERLRLGWPKSDLDKPEISKEVKLQTRTVNQRADELDQVGDILAGLQADWDRLGPMVRDGFLRQRAEFEARKEQREETEAAA